MQRFHLANDSVIQHCLKEDPEERFQNIEALRKAVQPKRWPFAVLAVVVAGLLFWMLSNVIRQNEMVPVQHDTLYIMQLDTVFVPKPKPELNLDDSLALFKEELQNALAPTFSSCYVEINNLLKVYSDAKGYTAQDRLEIMQLYSDKALATSRGIIREKINMLHLSTIAKQHYEKAAQEVIDYYLKDYRKLKKELEK